MKSTGNALVMQRLVSCDELEAPAGESSIVQSVYRFFASPSSS